MTKRITAEIELTTALHIGVGKKQTTTDAPVRRDSGGRLFIPGRALGGSLRSLATRLAPRLELGSTTIETTCQVLREPADQDPNLPCGCLVCNLFGDVYPVDTERVQKMPSGSLKRIRARAARLW
ncbi:MAG: RAMP superfamily CRISPR-associated protein, partial [Chloroflexota bacterium]